MVTTILLICITLAFLIFSIIKSRKCTKKAVTMALKMAKGMVLEIFSVLALVALVLGLLPKKVIADLLGETGGFLSSVYAAGIGAVTIIPGIIAFPLAKELQVAGAGLGAVAAFITTLTMVGIATSPIEYKHFGLKFTLLRNSLSFICAIGIAVLMGVIL